LEVLVELAKPVERLVVSLVWEGAGEQAGAVSPAVNSDTASIDAAGRRWMKQSREMMRAMMRAMMNETAAFVSGNVSVADGSTLG